MFERIRFVHPARSFDCKDYGLYFSSADFEALHYATKTPDNFEPPHNYPKCCAVHRHLEEAAEAYMQRFPFCCDMHAKLAGQPWFNRNDYIDIPKKILATFSHTEF